MQRYPKEVVGTEVPLCLAAQIGLQTLQFPSRRNPPRGSKLSLSQI